jgi:ABC-type glycerol-3-phosphate transport system substrate-binding protein
MRHGKRGAVGIIAAVLVFAAVTAGCSRRHGSSNGGSAVSSGGFADYSGGFPTRVTIEIPVYDRAFEGWNVVNNYYTRWIQQEFGSKYNVEVKYVGIERSSEVQDYIQMLASHRAPDIIFHYDMPQAIAYYSQDVMQQLNWAEIEHYAPTYWKYSGATIRQYGTIDNREMFFFAERPAADNWTTLIRKDWVEKAGYRVEDLTSLEVYNQMLLKWKELGLGVHGEQLVQNNFIYSYPFRDWPVNEKERTLYSELSVADMTWKPARDYLENLNYRYNNGLMDRDFYLRNDDAKTRAEFVAGRTGNYTLYLAANTDIITALKANNPGAEAAILPPRAGVPRGKQPQSRAYWPFGMIMGINYETSDTERIAIWMFLEWLSLGENLFKLQNGVAGQNYNLDANGIPVKAAGFSGESVMSQNNNKDYWCLVTEGARYANEAIFWRVNRINWAPPGYETLADDLINYYRNTAGYRTPDPLFTVNLATVAEYKADLNVLWQQLYVQCVTCPEAAFESTYTAACKTFLNAGYQAILDEKQAAINAGSYVK